MQLVGRKAIIFSGKNAESKLCKKVTPKTDTTQATVLVVIIPTKMQIANNKKYSGKVASKLNKQ